MIKDKIIFRKLELDECVKINDMNPKQYIGKAWREISGKRQLIAINYEDKDWPNGYEYHYNNLRKTIIENGIALGAFSKEGQLLGFITINREVFGQKIKYVLLEQLFITLEYRGKGIGKSLFMKGIEEIRGWGVDKLYICAGSAEETISFYFSLGCKEAMEVNKELYESDPRDYQLEFEI